MSAVVHQPANQRMCVELLREVAPVQQLHNAPAQHTGARVEDGRDPFVGGSAEDGEQKIDERQADGDL
jgi:hypothetical protein